MVRILLLAAAVVMAPLSSARAGSLRDERLHSLIAAHLQRSRQVRGEALTVIGPAWSWTGAVGRAGDEALTIRHAFRIASATKPFTAAAILRLHECGMIDISRPIRDYISPASEDMLRAAGYDTTAITVRQLLSHTSGLRDYATDPRFVARVLKEPQHRWTRAEQITLAMTAGGPLAPAGQAYAYADTGYVLLGEIIERRTGQPLGPAVRSLLRYKQIGLTSTWWERLEPPARGIAIAPAYLGDIDMGPADPSFDLYGGGGLISTVGDLARFYRALVRGEIFDRRETLAILMTATGATRPSGSPGLHNNALSLIHAGRLACWGHAGFWGQLVAYCPEADLAFAWTINQSEEERASAQRFLNDLAEVAAP